MVLTARASPEQSLMGSDRAVQAASANELVSTASRRAHYRLHRYRVHARALSDLLKYIPYRSLRLVACRGHTRRSASRALALFNASSPQLRPLLLVAQRR